MNKTATEIATILAATLNEEFGGKTGGRFRISRINLRMLFGQGEESLESSADKIIRAGIGIGILISDLGDYFSVVEASAPQGYRPVPKHILYQFMNMNHNELVRSANTSTSKG